MKSIKTIAGVYTTACIEGYAKATTFVRTHATALLFVVGTLLLVSGLEQMSQAQVTVLATGGGNSFSEAKYDDTLVRNAVGNLFGLIEGAFGALVMVVSGLGAIVAAAMGAYRAAVGMLVVAVGAFILRALVSLFFGSNFSARNVTGGAGG